MANPYKLIIKKFTYNKHQKLKSRKLVDELFTSGKSMLAFPLKVVFTVEKVAQPKVLSGIGVSKKHFKKAHDRNYVKRIVRETFRVHKNEIDTFANINNLNLHFFLLFIDKQLPNFEQMNTKMPTILKKIIEHLNAEIHVK